MMEIKLFGKAIWKKKAMENLLLLEQEDIGYGINHNKRAKKTMNTHTKNTHMLSLFYSHAHTLHK